jgi:hypothetical protein
MPLTAIAYTGYYAAFQRRDIATTRQRTKIGNRHHAARQHATRQRGALARSRARPDLHPTLTIAATRLATKPSTISISSAELNSASILR